MKDIYFIIFILLAIVCVMVAFYLSIFGFVGNNKATLKMLNYEIFKSKRKKKKEINQVINNRLEIEKDKIVIDILKNMLIFEDIYVLLNEGSVFMSISNWIKLYSTEDYSISDFEITEKTVSDKYNLAISSYISSEYGKYLKLSLKNTNNIKIRLT